MRSPLHRTLLLMGTLLACAQEPDPEEPWWTVPPPAPDTETLWTGSCPNADHPEVNYISDRRGGCDLITYVCTAYISTLTNDATCGCGCVSEHYLDLLDAAGLP